MELKTLRNDKLKFQQNENKLTEILFYTNIMHEDDDMVWKSLIMWERVCGSKRNNWAEINDSYTAFQEKVNNFENLSNSHRTYQINTIN